MLYTTLAATCDGLSFAVMACELCNACKGPCGQLQMRGESDNSFADDLNTSGIVSAESSPCATIH